MSSLFSGVNMALRALLANQQAIDVINHNVANANTPGYRRQSAVLSTSTPYSPNDIDHGATYGMMGSGVQVDQIKRIADTFADARYRGETSDASRWAAQRNALASLEAVLGETKDTGLIKQLDQFFTKWQAVSSNPTDTSARQLLLENASGLAHSFHQRASQIDAAQKDLNTEIIQQTGLVNQMAGQVAELNQKIASQANLSSQPNDLLDQRDALLDQISEISGISSSIQPNGEVLLSIGGHVLVASNQAYQLNAAIDPDTGLPTLQWEDGQAAQVSSGKLAGLITARTSDLPSLRSGLDTLASQLVQMVNGVHVHGYGLDNANGRSFFSGTNADDIQLDAAVDGHPERVASAAAADSPGDNTIARQIADLANTKGLNGGSQTLGEYYNSQVTGFGIAIQQAGAKASLHQAAQSAIATQRESVSGVSLDEEAANLVRYQRAYQAATRVMTAVDEMLDQVINNMGLVGR